MAGLINKAKKFFAEKIADMPKPEATVTDVSVKKFSRNTAAFESEVSVTNPYGHPLPICKVAYTLKSNSRVIASGTMPDPGSLKADDVTKLVVHVDVPYDFMITLMRDVGRDWDIDYKLDIGLTIDLPIFGNFTIPLSTEGEIKLPTLSDIF